MLLSSLALKLTFTGMLRGQHFSRVAYTPQNYPETARPAAEREPETHLWAKNRGPSCDAVRVRHESDERGAVGPVCTPKGERPSEFFLRLVTS